MAILERAEPYPACSFGVVLVRVYKNSRVRAHLTTGQRTNAACPTRTGELRTRLVP
jgi:hypothetical protein